MVRSWARMVLALMAFGGASVAAAVEEGGMRNAALQAGPDGVPSDWQADTGPFAYAALKEGLPAGVACGFSATVKAENKAPGFIRQRLPVPQGLKAFLLGGWFRSDLPGGAYFQIILLKEGKELRRVTSLVSRPQWDRLEMAVPVAGADELFVLCRWAADAKAVGKSCAFAGLSWRKAECYVALAGDSIVVSYPLEGNQRGWGETLAGRFTPAVAVANFAAGGRSTKTFRQEKRWEALLATRPDYVLIQFGHNDSHAPGRPESTDAATEYLENLRQYVQEARAAGAVPLLVTPPHRRTFAGGQLTTELAPYAASMRTVAQELKVPLLDLHAASGEWLTRLGEVPAAPFFVTEKDRTHFSLSGAQTMAQLLAAALPAACPELAARLAPAPAPQQ